MNHFPEKQKREEKFIVQYRKKQNKPPNDFPQRGQGSSTGRAHTFSSGSLLSLNKESPIFLSFIESRTSFGYLVTSFFFHSRMVTFDTEFLDNTLRVEFQKNGFGHWVPG
ncbi:hypothetical protein CDAR_57011 [Caerostris darwini]|uniref:Uncharacterized protein n=1 Tax=Caerostris darwini TaxID=1538125 RepID=A0AAV4QI76_9ARAC|nr:hypothetical protein CDAR_57011 [Caerostris darwini]